MANSGNIMNIIFCILLFNLSFMLAQSDAEVKKAKEIIKKSGMSESQVRAAAKAHGYSDEQIEIAIQKELNTKIENNQLLQNKIKNDIEDPDKGKYSGEENNINSDGKEIDIQNEIELELFSEGQPGKELLNYFGYDIFKQDPAIFQASSVGSVAPGYLIGPGDEIIVTLWGETQFRQVLTVDREGLVFISEIGQVFVNGLDLGMLESKLFRVLSQSYASLNPIGRKPTTFLDISLGNLRPLRIQVLGEVAQPGAYTVSPSTSLFSALYYFNGPTTLGSLRDIRLIRSDRDIATIDYYDYLLSGKKPEDKKLQLDDIVFIPRRLKTVAIEGEINRPGIYELKEDEKLSDLVSIAGNLKVTAYLDRAQIDRVVSFEDRKELGMDRMFIDINLGKYLNSDKNELTLQDGDHIQVFSILDPRLNVVELSGAIARPGKYDIGNSMKLSELIIKADSLLGDAYMDRVDIIRINPDLSEQIIKLNLTQVFNENPKQDIFLQSMDKVHVYSLTEMIPQAYVEIVGHIKNPGRYLLRENMSLYDLVFGAGGILDESFWAQTYMERADLIRYDENQITQTIIPFNLGDILLNKGSEIDFKLLPDDKIQIYSKAVFNQLHSISINGAIRNPGTYNLYSGMTVKDLILISGGVSEDVFLYNIEIARIDPEKVDNNNYAEIIKIDMYNDYSIEYSDSEVFRELDDSTEFMLKPYDYVSVRPDPFFKMQKKVVIEGAVQYPGVYSLTRPNEKITDILDRAGGFLPMAYVDASTLTRKGQIIRIGLKSILKKPSSINNISMQDGDEIFIQLKPDLIQILGEVSVPGSYKYISGLRVKDYIKKAGNYTLNAEKKDVWITYPNGNSQRCGSWYQNPKVLDGSIITVGIKKESEPFDKTEFAKEIASIISDLAQVVILILIAT